MFGRKDRIQPLRLPQVHVEELAVQRNDRARDEIVDVVGELEQLGGGRGQGADDRAVQAEDDRQLDQRRQTAAERIEAHFLIQFQLLLLQLLLVILVLLLHVLPRLGSLHLLHLLRTALLLQGERQGHEADQGGEDDDRQPEVVPEQIIDPQQAVDHRIENDGIPHGLALPATSPARRSSAWRRWPGRARPAAHRRRRWPPAVGRPSAADRCSQVRPT